MGELIVACFGEPYRAPQVIHEMRRICPSSAPDLDNAIALRWSEDGSIRVQQSVDPTSQGGAAWSRLWGAFISRVFLLTRADRMQAAANAFVVPGSSPSRPDGSDRPMEPTWWTDEFGLSEEFLRDAGALLQPGESVIVMIATVPKPQALVRELRNQGGTVIHFALSREQCDKLRSALAPHPRAVGSGGR